MKIFSYVASLLPRLTKDQVLEDLRHTGEELVSVAQPTYRNGADFFRTSKFESDKVRDLQDSFNDKFDRSGGPKQSTFLGEINARLPFLVENTEYVTKQCELLFERDIVSDGLTAKKALLMRAAEHLSFLSRLSLDVLNYVYTFEALAAGVEVSDDSGLSPAEAGHVERNIGVFASLLGDYGVPNKDFEKILLAIPEVVVSSRSEAQLASVFKERDLDPFKGQYVQGFTGNPIYHLRLLVAQWQASRYKANKDKKKMLELRLLHLELLKEKKNDPKIEQEIDYVRGRVASLDRYLREVEESVEAEV